MAMSDGRPFQLQYDSPAGKAMRGGATASTGDDLKKDPPPFDPRQLQARFIKSGTNPLKTGFNRQEFDPSTVQGLIDKAGVTPNFGDFGNTMNQKDESNILGKKFLENYRIGVERKLIERPVSEATLATFVSDAAPYQKGEGLTNVSKPFPGGSFNI